MSITRSQMLTAIGQQYKRALTIKTDEAYQAMQYVCDDIADKFPEFHGLEDASSALAATYHQSYVDISTALAEQHGNRITQVALANTANNDDDTILDEIDFTNEYLPLVPNTASPNDDTYGIPYEYARYTDYLYLYFVPDLTTYTIKVYFGKRHPAISGSQDILYPREWKETILDGCLWRLYTMVERSDSIADKHFAKYEKSLNEKINAYAYKPNVAPVMKCNY